MFSKDTGIYLDYIFYALNLPFDTQGNMKLWILQIMTNSTICVHESASIPAIKEKHHNFHTVCGLVL